MFIYLTASKVLDVLMDWKKLNQLLALEQVSGVIRAPQMSMMMLLAKKVSKVNLKLFYS